MRLQEIIEGGRYNTIETLVRLEHFGFPSTRINDHGLIKSGHRNQISEEVIAWCTEQFDKNWWSFDRVIYVEGEEQLAQVLLRWG